MEVGGVGEENMIIAIGILTYFIITLAFTLFYVCYECEFLKDEWLAVIMLVLCPPIWVALCYIVRAIRKAKRKAKINKINQGKNDEE